MNGSILFIFSVIFSVIFFLNSGWGIWVEKWVKVGDCVCIQTLAGGCVQVVFIVRLHSDTWDPLWERLSADLLIPDFSVVGLWVCDIIDSLM
jgi:hypothetical protein